MNAQAIPDFGAAPVMPGFSVEIVMLEALSVNPCDILPFFGPETGAMDEKERGIELEIL